jgi:hypothetical protein
LFQPSVNAELRRRRQVPCCFQWVDPSRNSKLRCSSCGKSLAGSGGVPPPHDPVSGRRCGGGTPPLPAIAVEDRLATSTPWVLTVPG